MEGKTAGKTALILSLLLVLPARTVYGASVSGGEGSYYPKKEHAEIALSDMERELFDEELFRQTVAELEEICSRSGQQERLTELYQIILDQTNRLYTESALASLDYYSDMTDKAAKARLDEVDGGYADIMDAAARRSGPSSIQSTEIFFVPKWETTARTIIRIMWI